MSSKRQRSFRLTERDIDFLLETVSSEVTNKWRLKQIIREDEDFRNRFISEETVFRRVMDDEEILLKISPALFFEILLRKAVTVLEEKTYTFEKTSTMRIPVFDSHDVVDCSIRNPCWYTWQICFLPLRELKATRFLFE